MLPGQAQEKPQMAEVVAVGPGTKDVEMELKVGDKVIFAKYSGTEVKWMAKNTQLCNKKIS